MSYDLSFWRYASGVVMNHQQVYLQLSDGKHVEGVQSIPIPSMLAKFRMTMVGWEWLNENTLEGPDSQAMQVFTTPQFFRVDCHGVSAESMNKVIEFAGTFGCSLYDAQVGERFDGE
jgi:hypothetical protein